MIFYYAFHLHCGIKLTCRVLTKKELYFNLIAEMNVLFDAMWYLSSCGDCDRFVVGCLKRDAPYKSIPQGISNLQEIRYQ